MSETGFRGEQTLALVLATHQFSTLIHAGVCMVNCLRILEEEAPPPYNAAMQALRQRVERGETLTQAVHADTEHFPPVYRMLVHVGEVGGILGETLHHAAQLLEEAWQFSCLIGRVEASAILTWTGDGDSGAQDWAAMPEDHRLYSLMLFCRAFGMMLTSGVPIVQAMEVSADILPPVQRAQWLAARTAVREGARLSAATFLPASVRQLTAIGEETGSLDAMMQQLADMYHSQLLARRWAQVAPAAN